MKKLLRLFFPLSLRVRFLLATAAVVLVLSLAYGMVALIGYSVSFDKTTFRLLRGESNLFYTQTTDQAHQPGIWQPHARGICHHRSVQRYRGR